MGFKGQGSGYAWVDVLYKSRKATKLSPVEKQRIQRYQGHKEYASERTQHH